MEGVFVDEAEGESQCLNVACPWATTFTRFRPFCGYALSTMIATFHAEQFRYAKSGLVPREQ